MSKKVIFLADSISTQTAGIHFYGRQLIETIIQQFPEYNFTSISSSRIDNVHVEQITIPIKQYIPSHLRLRQLTTIPKLVRQLAPDIVIELAHFGPFALPDKIKRMTVIHDLSAVTHPQFHPLTSHLVQKISLPRIINKAHTIITNSYFTKSEIMKLYNTAPVKIQVLYPQQKSISEDSSDVSDTPPQAKYFLCVGTIEPRKNYISVIKAFEKILAVFPEYKLIIAGKSGWKNDTFYNSLENSTAQSNIELTGYVSHHKLVQLYKGAFAFISASHFEGFGMPILEAARFDLPLIIANNSAQYEIAKDAALFFDSNDIIKLEEHIRTMITNDELRLELKKKSSLMADALLHERQHQLAKLQL